MKNAIPITTIILICALLAPAIAQAPKKSAAKKPTSGQPRRGAPAAAQKSLLATFKGEWDMKRNSFAKTSGMVAVWGTDEKVSIEQPMDGDAIQFRLWESFAKFSLGQIPLGASVSHEYDFVLKFDRPSGKYLLTVQTKMAATKDNMAIENLPLRYVAKNRQLVGEGKGTIGLLAVTVKAVIKLGEPAEGHSWLITGHDASGAEKDKYEIKFSPKKG